MLSLSDYITEALDKVTVDMFFNNLQNRLYKDLNFYICDVGNEMADYNNMPKCFLDISPDSYRLEVTLNSKIYRLYVTYNINDGNKVTADIISDSGDKKFTVYTGRLTDKTGNEIETGIQHIIQSEEPDKYIEKDIFT